MSSKLKFSPSLKGRTVIITGATRGIGKQCALDLAKLGCNIVVAAKTVEPQPTLPGTIYTVAAEIRELGVEALAYQLDVRNWESCQGCVSAAMAKFGRVDILINNASALWWKDIEDTPMSKYDLITGVNARGTFAMTKACLPHMKAQGWGHVICMSPPIHTDGISGKTAYSISKFGMTLVALGTAQENLGQGIAANTLWPATVIESYAAINFALGEKSDWRKATILSDCVCSIVSKDPDTCTGNMFWDDDYLREYEGFETADFACYQGVPGIEPPLLLRGEKYHDREFQRANFERGLVSEISENKAMSKLKKETMEPSSKL